MDHSPGWPLPARASSKSPSPFDAAKVTVSARPCVAAGSHAASRNAQSAMLRKIRIFAAGSRPPAKGCLPPIGRAGFFGELDVMGDMMRPREKRDAILGHVASWGDRKAPMA